MIYSDTPNRFEKTAAKIQKQWGVRVEWACANREYVVEGRPVSSASQAEKIAKNLYYEANAMMGGSR